MSEDKNSLNRLLEASDPLLKKGYQPVVQRPVLPPPQGESVTTPATSMSPQSETAPIHSVHISEGYQPIVQRPVLPPPQGTSGIMPPPVVVQQEGVQTTPSTPNSKK